MKYGQLNFILVLYRNVSQLTYYLIKNVLFLVHTGQILELGFPKCL